MAKLFGRVMLAAVGAVVVVGCEKPHDKGPPVEVEREAWNFRYQ